MAANRKNVLSSLAVYAGDSEPEIESDGELEDDIGGLVSKAYGQDDISRIEEDGSNREDDDTSQQSEDEDSETENQETGDTKDKIHKLYERKLKEGTDMNNMIQKKKEFRNPSIYEKLIQFCSIDELGTNYPKDMFDPHGWSEDSYYESLAKAQKIEMDKLEKAKKERTKIEFVTGTKKGTTTSVPTGTTSTTTTATADAQKRKSKWDSAIPVTTIAQPTILTTTATLPAVVTVTTSASGSKTTVISAVGTIVKKAKQ
ncbi:SAP30-binding protein isoform 2-T2 [Pelodytes ibericus]